MRPNTDSLATGGDTKSYLQPGEDARWGDPGVEEANRQDRAVQRSRSFLTGGGVIDDDEAQRRVTLGDVGYAVNPRTGDATLSGVDPRGVMPATRSDIVKHIHANYPAVTSAALTAGLSPLDMLRHTNFTMAADAALNIAMTPNPRRQAQIFNTMGPDMQYVTSRILQSWWDDSQKKAQVAEDNSTGNMVTDTAATIWAYTGSPLFDFLYEANQLAIRSVNAAGLAGSQWTTGNMVSLEDAWRVSAPGTMNVAGVKYARDKWGDATVDVILEVMQAGRSEDDDAVGQLYEKYNAAQDYDKLAIIDAVLFGVNADQTVQDAATYLASQDVGNVGNNVFWGLSNAIGLGPLSDQAADWAQTPLLTGTRDVTNVTATFAFDPTLGIGVAGKGYMAARYGLRLLAPGKIEGAFQKKAVRTFFDTFGSALTKADDAADQTQRAQILNSVRSQYKGWFDADGIDELFKAGVRTADDALEYFRGAENVRLILAGQTARRSSQVVIPHMLTATAQVKRASLVARGLTYDGNAAAKIDEIFGPGVSQMLPEEAVPIVIKRLSETDGDKFVGRMLSDFVFADDTARRTFVGWILNRKGTGTAYGWRRNGGLRARGERASRLLAHMPDVGDGLRVVDGRDAAKVRDLMLFAGMPKWWADWSATAWRGMDQGQRVRFASGMGRSIGFARGIDIVDPANGRALIDEMVMGARQGELYAPDQQDLASLRGQANRTANTNLTRIALSDPAAGGLAGAAAGTTATTADGFTVLVAKNGSVVVKRDKAFRKAVTDASYAEMDTLKANAPWYNPSRAVDEQVDATNGLYYNQMTDRIAFPDLNRLERLSMKQSYLTALLGNNPTITSVVDFWTLGTLAGPRFQLRNGLEDAGLYALTGGSWKGYRAGRSYSTAKREATQRARKEMTEPIRGEKLGFVKSSSRWLGDHLPSALQGIILPHLDEADIAAANALAAQGDRTGLVKLINKALLRGKAKFIRGGSLDAQTVKDLDEASEFLGFFNMMDDVSESARHLADGVPPGVSMDDLDVRIVNGQPVRFVTVDKQFRSLKVKKGDPTAVRAWWNNLAIVLHGDRGKGQAAVARIRKYHAAKMSGDPDKVREVVEEFATWIETKAPWVLERSGIAATEGVQVFARKNLDDVLRLFTTKRGGFNNELFEKIRRADVDAVTGETKVTYALWDDGPGGVKQNRVFEQDLAEMKGRPQSVLDYEGVKIPVTPNTPLNQKLWNVMGRSLARMTREPIFVSNYLDSRNLLRPIEERLAADIGPEAAKKWAVEAAYERSYAVTMSYIDNPAVRSQMAWNVRNVARFYRALEDFNRRMIRVAKYQPETFQKINLGWRVLDDTGFVHTDEYGDQYFIWPGSRIAFDAINKITGAMGLPVATAGLPLSFSSKVSMLTPSADPNSWFPTLSSPYATLALAPLMSITPGLQGLQQEVFGEYSTGQAIWTSIVPSNFMRLWELGNAFKASDTEKQAMATSQFASAARSAVQAYAAAGLFDESRNLTPKEIADMRQTINWTALDIMVLRTVLSPTTPAAISVTADSVTDFAREMGVDGMRETFVQVLKAHDGDMDAAMVAWVSANPDRSIFTVSANTNGEDIGNYGPFKETVSWIEANSDIVDQHPVGAAFFAPQEGTQNLAAWSYLRAMGAKVPKTVEQYFNEVATQQGYAIYNIYKNQYEDAVAAGRKDAVQGPWDVAKRDLYARFPMLESRIMGELKTTELPARPDSSRVVEDIRGAIQMVKARGGLDERGSLAEQVIGMHDEAKAKLSELSTDDPNYADHKSNVRRMWVNMIADMKTRYPDDRQWESLLYAVTGSLGFRDVGL